MRPRRSCRPVPLPRGARAAPPGASASADDIALVEQVSDQAATRGGGRLAARSAACLRRPGRQRARDHGAAGRRVVVPDRFERGRGRESRSRHPGGVPGGSWDVGPRRPGARAGVDRRPGRRRDVRLERWDRWQGDGGQLRGHATERRPGDRPRRCAGRGGGSDHLLFPAAPPPTSSPADTPSSTVDGAPRASAVPVSATAAPTAVVTDEDEPTIFRGGRGAPPPGRTPPRTARPAGSHPSIARRCRPKQAARTECFGSPAPTQARLDTRPGSNARPETPARSRRPAGGDSTRFLRSRLQWQARGRRGSQRSSSPSRSCRRSCCGYEKRRPSGGRRTSSHRSTSLFDPFATPSLTRRARARRASVHSAVTKGCEIRVTQTARTRSACSRAHDSADGIRGGLQRVRQRDSEGERPGVDSERDGRPDRRRDVDLRPPTAAPPPAAPVPAVPVGT